jgi:hypothetical protein
MACLLNKRTWAVVIQRLSPYISVVKAEGYKVTGCVHRN